MKPLALRLKKLLNGMWSVTGNLERPDQPGVFDPYYEVKTKADAERIVYLYEQGRQDEIDW